MAAVVALIVLSAFLGSGQAQAVEIVVPRTEAVPDEAVRVPLFLYAEGAVVKKVVAEISVETPLRFVAKEDGSPACESTPSPEGAYEFLPVGCRDSACVGVRVTRTFEGQGSGDAVVTHCEVDVSGASAGRYPVAIDAASAFDPAGASLPTSRRSEGIAIPELPRRATIEIGSATLQAGGTADVPVRLKTTVEAGISETDNFIFFPYPGISIVTDERGEPRCAVNPDIHKNARFDLDNNSLYAVVRGPFSYPLMPSDDVTLYTCTFHVDDSVPAGTYVLVCLNAHVYAPTHTVMTERINGELLVLAADGTPVPSATPTPSSTATPPEASSDNGCAIGPGQATPTIPLGLLALMLARLSRARPRRGGSSR